MSKAFKQCLAHGEPHCHHHHHCDNDYSGALYLEVPLVLVVSVAK